MSPSVLPQAVGPTPERGDVGDSLGLYSPPSKSTGINPRTTPDNADAETKEPQQPAIPYCYCPLLPGQDNIRLLRLLPSEDENAPLRCQLFNYSLEESDKRTHPYDALSYVWGKSDETRLIFIDKHDLLVTPNLHEALLHLRYCSIERIIWIDAVCINQKDTKEKERQIRFMGKIYGQANRVVVWLGEAADNSDQALEEIRYLAGGKVSTNSSNKETIQKAILALLRRPWFRRIWVLQEVGAARHVLVMCGPTVIDGYAFCLGVDSLEFQDTRVDLQNLIPLVTFLIRGAIFRQSYTLSGRGMVSQDICSLGELIDMYHTHKATLRHDKVYALLGMSSDDTSKAKLLPKYSIPWEELFQRLIKFLVCEKISVETWPEKEEIAVIKSKGCILGKVSSVRIARNGRQDVDIIFNNVSKQPGHGEWSGHWILQSSAKSIQDEDLICLLQGASKPLIIRLCKDYFAIIMIAATLESTKTGSEDIRWLNLLQSAKIFPRDFLLVWNWEKFPEQLQDLGNYEALMQANDLASEHATIGLEGQLDNATRSWNVALILEDAEEHVKAQERIQEAIKGYKEAVGEDYPYTLKSQYSQTPLSWAAGNGCNAIVKLLLAKDSVDPDLKERKFGLTLLWWAAKYGHEAVVKLLLEIGKVKVNSKDKNSQTPLWCAVENGHKAIVKLLLKIGKVKVNSKDKYSRTLLWWAVVNGHKAVVKLLLEMGKVEVNFKDKDGWTPLRCAVKYGHEAVVKLLLEIGKIEVDFKDKYGRTLLW